MILVDEVNGHNVYALDDSIESGLGYEYVTVAVSRSCHGEQETAVFGVRNGEVTWDDILVVPGHVSDEKILSMI